jgi:hypothetical protein
MPSRDSTLLPFSQRLKSLRAGILHDVPELLKSIGAEVGDELDLGTAQNDLEALQQFKMLPRMFSGQQSSFNSLHEEISRRHTLTHVPRSDWKSAQRSLTA